jgi:2,3-bisphosphoglycerate-dependent phosphoglycerate mutase
MHDGSTRVLALRHGQTAWNAEQRLQGQLDIPLDATGRWQAERLAEALAGEGIELIFSSDLARAARTAAPTAARLGLPVVHDAALRERGFGVFEGRTYAEIETRWPDEARRWRSREPGFGPEGGETLLGFQQRAVAAVTRLAQAHAGRSLAVFTHGGVLDALYRAAAGLDVSAPRAWVLGNASINRLLWTGERWARVGWDDAAHLEGGPPEAAQASR